MDAPEEREGGGDGDAVTPMRCVALPRGVHGGAWTVLVPSAMASEWTVVHVPAGVVRAASRGGGAVPEVAIDMAALQAALNGRCREDPDLQLRSGHRGVGDVAERGGGAAGGPCYCPVVFVRNPNKEADKKEDRSAVAKAILRICSSQWNCFNWWATLLSGMWSTVTATKKNG